MKAAHIIEDASCGMIVPGNLPTKEMRRWR